MTRVDPTHSPAAEVRRPEAWPDPSGQRWPSRFFGAGALLRMHVGLVFVYLYAPIAILVAFSFNRDRWSIAWEGFTLDWYRLLLTDMQTRDAAMNSLLVALAATIISTIVGTLAGMALGRYRFRARTATEALLYLPIIIPEIVLGVAMARFFGVVGVGELNLGLWPVIVAHVVFTVSFVAIIVRAAMAGLDATLLEAAADLGASPAGVFFRVTLPLLAPAILAGALLVFTISLDDYLVTSFVADVGSTTLPIKIYSMVKAPVTAKVNAISTVLLAFTVILILAAQLLLRGRYNDGGKT